MMRKALVGTLLICCTIPATSQAQSSVYGILGLGFPGRPIGTRTRAGGGGMAMFDARSALNPATASGFQRISVAVVSGTTLRNYTVLDSTVEGLSDTRSPIGIIGGNLGRTPVSFALSYSTYLERTYDLFTEDTVVIRNEPIAVTDRISEDGAVVDIRGALGARVTSWLSVGGAVHVLSGSSKRSTRREFSSPDYFPVLDTDRLVFSGLGFSAGVLASLDPRLTVAAAIRSDGTLDTGLDSSTVSEFDLPLSYAAGLTIAPVPAIRLATTAIFTSWSGVSADLTAIGGANAFDHTWDIGTGLELGGSSRSGRVPLLLGFRYAELPFSPTLEQPTELSFSGGTNFVFANGRVMFDLSLERILRDGGRAEERAWYLTFSLTVSP